MEVFLKFDASSFTMASKWYILKTFDKSKFWTPSTTISIEKYRTLTQCPLNLIFWCIFIDAFSEKPVTSKNMPHSMPKMWSLIGLKLCIMCSWDCPWRRSNQISLMNNVKIISYTTWALCLLLIKNWKNWMKVHKVGDT